MVTVALTGGIATGKSYVRTRLAEHGIPTLDADVLAREAVAAGTSGLAAGAERFGANVTYNIPLKGHRAPAVGAATAP